MGYTWPMNAFFFQVAEYIKFQLPELQIFNKKFEEEESRELEKIRRRWA